MRPTRNYPANWREYQAKLKRAARHRRLLIRLTLLSAILGCVFVGLFFYYPTDTPPSGNSSQPSHQPLTSVQKLNIWPEKIPRRALSDYLISRVNKAPGDIDQFIFEIDGYRFKIMTTLDTKLQKYINRLLKRSRTLQAAVVVLNPSDGRILAMASRDTGGNAADLCLKADFPAASLFKIVSAAAALEAAGYTLDQTLFYQGSKHTLYKYQLKESKGPYSAPTNFRKAFANSNNSVFGKIGIYALGQKTIAEYAEKFLFNKSIPFDLPVAVSTAEVPEDDFGLAEIASGFNKRTLVSPLHATLLSAMVVNSGGMKTPWIVSSIADGTNKIVYRARNSVLNSPIGKKTAADLKTLMQYAARYGTTRSAFRKLRRQKASADVALGAKTGTINDTQDRFKYDWITAFALAPDGARGICVGILAVHGEKLGTRATEFARAIIDYYFGS
jgi:cell division protein FtsI/penicillin-binding protein 2